MRVLVPPRPGAGADLVWELDDAEHRLAATGWRALAAKATSRPAEAGSLYELIETFRDVVRDHGRDPGTPDANALAATGLGSDDDGDDDDDDGDGDYVLDDGDGDGDVGDSQRGAGATAELWSQAAQLRDSSDGGAASSRAGASAAGGRGAGNGAPPGGPSRNSGDAVLPVFSSGEPFEDRRSVFQAHVATVHTAAEVHAGLAWLKQDKKIARATHNIMAYRIVADGRVLQDNDDDGETAAGSRLAHLLDVLGVQNTLVVVSRWYGGIQLGPDRFKHINSVARKELEAAGHLATDANKAAAHSGSGAGGRGATGRKRRG